MKVLDLFSGIGGFSLGLERAGMETVAFCEIDTHARKVLEKHWPDVPIYNDVKAIKPSKWFWLPGDIDVVCGGFPCQDISVAGQKKGIKDGTRSGLWKEFARVIKEVKPRYALIENVANLRNLGLNQVIKDLWQIGYACEWHIISARSVGACHLRERVWVIAYPNNIGCSIKKQFRESIQEAFSRSGEQASNDELTNSNGKGLERQRESVGIQEAYAATNGTIIGTPDTDMPRLWRPFASEEESSRWWTETTASFRDWWKVESDICRVDDGLPRGLDKDRRERIKQLGNTVVPQIPELIGRAIIKYEESL